MSLQVSDILTAARDRHPLLTRQRVPDAVLVRELTGYQRRLISQCADLDSNFVAQQCSIIFATSSANTPAAVAAGSQGGLPADDSKPGQVATAYKDTGPAVEVDFDSSPVLVGDVLITAADAVSVTIGGVYPVNQFANAWVKVVLGPGKEQVRKILSSTVGGQLVISTGADGQQWQSIPSFAANNGSLVRVCQSAVLVDDANTLVTEITPTDTRTSFIVKIDNTGRPFIDPTQPIIATFDRGISLPPYERIIGGTVRHIADSLISKLTIRPYRMRFQYGPDYTVWIENGQMFLCGAIQDWQNAAQIDLRYVPTGPAFAALTDYVLLDDDVYDTMVWRMAYIAAKRAAALPDTSGIDGDFFKEEWQAAEQNFLSSVGAHNRAYPVYIKDAW